MAATVAAYQDVLKEVWTADRLVQQFLDQNDLLKKIEQTERFTVGDKAIVPVHKGRSGGYSAKPAAGGALNGADEQQVDSCEFDFTYHYFEVEIENAAIQKTAGKASSVAAVIETEMDRATQDLRNQITRQVLGNGDALLAVCGTTTNSTTVNLATTGFGYDAIVRGFLYPGLKVDIGTAASEAADADAVTISAVTETSSDPEIVISGSGITTDGSDFVSIANNRSGTTSYETNGILQLAGSTTAAFGSLDPDTAGESFWKPANVDTTTTVLTLDKIYENQRKVHQKTGKRPSHIVTSLIQEENVYKQLEMKVRYSGDARLGTGNTEGVSISGSELLALPEVYDRHMFFLTLSDLFTVSMAKPDWMSSVEGAGGKLRWKQGNTAFVDAAFWYFNLAAKRRNSHAALTALTG
jgi:hypothetical protein